MPSNLPRLVTRVPQKIVDKVIEISKLEHRTGSKQIEHMICEYIRKYEKENGEIKIGDKKDAN